MFSILNLSEKGGLQLLLFSFQIYLNKKGVTTAVFSVQNYLNKRWTTTAREEQTVAARQTAATRENVRANIF